MTSSIKRSNLLGTCIACKSGVLGESLFRIPDLPLVDSFSCTRKAALEVPRISVDIRSCQTCGTIQVDNPVNPEEIYNEYIYESSSSPDLHRHFAQYKSDLLKRELISTTSKHTILEVGINDGLLAKEILRDTCSSIVGIDPSPQTGALDHQIKNLHIVNDYFSADTLAKNNLSDDRFDLIVANNVLSHIPDMSEVLSTMEAALADNGVLVFEVQSVAHLLERRVFDYIYHEHIFYHSLHSLSCLLDDVGLELYDVVFVETKGGSYRVYAAKKGQKSPSPSLLYFQYYESLIRPGDAVNWRLMRDYLDSVGTTLAESLSNFRMNKSHGRVIGYGACATGTVLQRYFNLEDYIDSLVDDNPKRQGLYSPGFGKEILPSSEIGDSDLILVLAWRHYQYFKQNIRNGMGIMPLFY